MIKISREFIEGGGGQAAFDDAIAVFDKALKDHSKTEGVPAPTTHPIIERLVRHHGGAYEIVEPPEPELAPEVDMYPDISVKPVDPEDAPELTIDELRAQRLIQLNAIRRNAINTAKVEYNGAEFWADRDSQSDLWIIRNIAANDPTYAIKFKAADSKYYILELADVDALVTRMRSQTQNFFNREERLIEAIKKSSKKFDVQKEWDAL